MSDRPTPGHDGRQGEGYVQPPAATGAAPQGSDAEKPITGVVLRSWHFTRWAARRARKRWLKGVRGRDAYVHRRGRFHWEVRRIDYAPLERALAGTSKPVRIKPAGTGAEGPLNQNPSPPNVSEVG